MRAGEARAAVSQAARVVVGDLASLAETRAVAEAAAGMGTYDAIIHNAGLGGADDRMVTEVGSSASSKSTCWRRTSLLASSLRPHVLFTSRPAWSGMRAAPGRPPI
jgi:NAD(P)-dependent dehydrogenase (short-subunit alcohol dehydrogenase family)